MNHFKAENPGVFAVDEDFSEDEMAYWIEQLDKITDKELEFVDPDTYGDK